MAAVTPTLLKLDPAISHEFRQPVKKILEGEDVAFFRSSKAYTDIMTFLLQLNAAMFPRKDDNGDIQTWQLGGGLLQPSPSVARLVAMFDTLEGFVEQAPPDTGPRRFGNVAFKKWLELAESRAGELLDASIPRDSLLVAADGPADPRIELKAYLLGSFGSVQRLDYGTGHELSFLAFLGGLWKLGGFEASPPGVEERGIVLNIMTRYMQLIRRLIKTYTLEPAGSHGVWGLDDHSFLPYVFGSAQLAAPIIRDDQIPLEGSLPDAPDPGDVTKQAVVEKLRNENLYFGAIGFINDVKRGPFWEHSPVLYDISGVRAGWAKINKGMIKMYVAEVLSKFPVVQHFPFGHLFQWERDPNAPPSAATAHMASQPPRAGQHKQPAAAAPGSAAPWASNAQGIRTADHGAARTPTNYNARVPQMPSTRAPWAAAASQPSDQRGTAQTKAPWAKD